MSLLIGQAITGQDVEQQITSGWPPERFPSMCDALAWAASGRRFIRMPSFTSLVNAADGGIDAEWDIEIPEDGGAVPTPLLGPGWNVFQYKQRDLMAQDRRRIVSNLKATKSGVRGAVNEIYNRHGRTPDRYILFVNIDLKHDQTRAIKEAIAEGCKDSSQLHIEVVGAAELAALLNDHPHLRAAYFAPLSFKTWQAAYKEHRSHKLLGEDVDLVGRKQETERLRSLVSDKMVRVLVVSGPHDIGKSRLVLEATKDRPHDVAVALDPRSMSISDYRKLVSDRAETICIVEDPEQDAVDSLTVEALSTQNLKVIITLPSASFVPMPSYGRDERVQNIHLKPLDDKTSHELLKATGHRLDFGIEEWILRQARGVPGIILAAASVGTDLRREWGDFLSNVGREFEKRTQSELGNEALKGARLFSILTHVGISGEFESEIRLICDLFSDGWRPADAIRALETLEQAGLARRGGSFAEISIPILANHLAGEALVGRKTEMFALFDGLDEPARVRFLRRLSEIKGPEVEKFWDEFFGQGGPLGDFKAALRNAHILDLVSGAVPVRMLDRLESGLLNTSRDERLSIPGEQRMELMWAVEQLLFRRKTSRGAMKLLWLLAEAESGGYASGVLAECFDPFHTQMPLPLEERLDLLRGFTLDKASKGGKITAIKAAGEALSAAGHMLRHSAGPDPLDSMPQFTYGDLYDYACNMIDILIAVAGEKDSEVTEVALSVLPNLVAEYASQGRSQEAIERFKRLADWVLEGKKHLDVSSLFEAMAWVRHEFSSRLENKEYPAGGMEEHVRFIEEIDNLQKKLGGSNFLVRLKRWAGGWTLEDAEEVKVDKKDIPRYELELKKLAEEAVNKPELLDTNAIDWLLSGSAQKSQSYFYQLGVADKKGSFRDKVEELGQKPAGANAFSLYWAGWAERDQAGAGDRLEKLASLNQVTGKAIVQATLSTEACPTSVERVKAQIRAGRVDASLAGRLLMGRWANGLSPVEFRDLLDVVAGDQFENASTAIHMLYLYMYGRQSIDDCLCEFAWRCLENDPVINRRHDAWCFDKVAAQLAQRDPDPERGFRLLKKLLATKREGERWDPIHRYGKHEFWSSLYRADKKRLLETVFEACRTDLLVRLRVTWNLKDILDLETDRDLLVSLARKDDGIASIISESITSAKPGFWPIADELVQLYPHNEKIQRKLACGIEQQGDVIVGPLSEFYERRKAEVEERLKAPDTPPAVRPWLQEMLDRLKPQVSHHMVWEYDIDVDGLQKYIDDKAAPERIWAIGRVLKYGNPKDWKELLSAEDIREALSQVDLPEKRRRVLETLLKV